MLDFTAALYLGLHHPSGTLRPWDGLTLGLPAALGEPPGAAAVAADLAAVQATEMAVLLPSTLHLFMDLFEVLAAQGSTICLDAGCYPIARWGAERVAAKGIPCTDFPHHDPDGLNRALARSERPRRRPVVVADGFCPVCGSPAPLDAYLAAVRRFGGTLVVDDTQALGILGQAPGPFAPYGSGGGGTLRWGGLSGPDILIGASLAKGFGAPVAALAGSASAVRRFVSLSDTRVHCSPPSVAAIHAAERALTVNRVHGNQLRQRLAQRVRQFRDGLARIGCSSTGGLFPVQTLCASAGQMAVRMYQRLLQWGVRTVLLRPHGGGAPRLSFLITARHSVMDIDNCLAALDELANGVKSIRTRR